jgi:tRNA(Arg) A34 adenosine deaminase TadA
LLRTKLDTLDAEPVRAAIRWAKASTMRYRHGACIADHSGLILVAAYNEPNGPQRSSIHAEISCLNKLIHGSFEALENLAARPDLYTLYSARVTKTGRTVMSLPCIPCQYAIIKLGIQRVVYTGSHGRPELVIL